MKKKTKVGLTKTFMSYKSWVCTLNNWTQPEYDHLVEMQKEHMTTLMIGKETAPDTGTPHLQIYLTLKKNRTLRWMKEQLTPRGHWQKANGDHDQNLTYISKEDPKPLIISTKKQGARTDLTSLYEKLQQGTTMEELMDTHPSFQHIRIAEKFFEYKGPKRPPGKRKCYWLYGPTGCGKTYDATHEFGDNYCIIDTNEGQKTWFDNYKNEKILILDELRPKSMSFKTLLTIMDEHTRWVEKKGSGCWGNWDIVVVTSPLPPHSWSDGTGWEQLERRLSVIRKYNPRDVPIPKPVYEEK